MSSLQLVNVWTDPTPGAGAFSPMPTSTALVARRTYNWGRRVRVCFRAWVGDYPHTSTARHIGPEFAERDYLFLSVCLRRRGMEGQLTGMPDDELRDIQLAVDFLHTHGCRQIFLVGEEMGAFSVARFVNEHQDARVSGVVLLSPTEEPAKVAKRHGRRRCLC